MMKLLDGRTRFVEGPGRKKNYFISLYLDQVVVVDLLVDWKCLWGFDLTPLCQIWWATSKERKRKKN
jgi:hypothetical protein